MSRLDLVLRIERISTLRHRLAAADHARRAHETRRARANLDEVVRSRRAREDALLRGGTIDGAQAALVELARLEQARAARAAAEAVERAVRHEDEARQTVVRAAHVLRRAERVREVVWGARLAHLERLDEDAREEAVMARHAQASRTRHIVD